MTPFEIAKPPETKMSEEYKVISDWFCLTPAHKARKIQGHLNRLSAEGWDLAALDSALVLGFDVGFYLVLKRPRRGAS